MLRLLLRTSSFFIFALLLSGFLSTQSSAECGLSLLTQDTTWSFSAAAGSTQSRTLTIENTSSDSMTVTITTGCDAFGVSHDRLFLDANDTASITITFKPGANTSGTDDCTLTVTNLTTSCHTTLGLVGTITGSNNGGHDKVVSLDPGTAYNFGTFDIGVDTCHYFYAINYTGSTATITNVQLVHPNADFSISPAFSSNVALDSAGYYRFLVCFTADSLHSEVNDSVAVTYTYNGETHTVADAISGHSTLKHPGSGNGGGDSTVFAPLYAYPHEFTFGQINVGNDSCVGVTVYNSDSNATVIITGWNTCDNKAFSVTPAYDNSNVTLSPQQTKSFKICYAPTEAGQQASCSLTLHYTTTNPSTDGKTFVINFSGSSPAAATTECLKFEQGDGYKDPVVIGASADRTLRLINNNSFSMTVTGDSLGCSGEQAFNISQTQFPITVAAHDSANLQYVFTPYSNSNANANQLYEGCVFLSISSDSAACTSAHSGIYGYSVHDSDSHSTDSIDRPLIPNEPRTLSIESHGDAPTKTFYFINNLSVDVTVNSMKMKNGTYFTVSGTNPTTPCTLHSNDQISVTIEYTATDNDVHYDTLLIDATHNLVQGPPITLEAVKATTSNVTAVIPDGVTITLAPNPMTSQITESVTGARTVTVEVYDILGTLITSAPSQNVWHWNATSSGGDRVAAGTYFVRTTGVSNLGVAFVTTKEVIVTN